MNKTKALIILGIIGFSMIVFSFMFLRTTKTFEITKFDIINLPSDTYISIPVYLGKNDIFNFDINVSTSRYHLEVLLSSSSKYYDREKIVRNITPIIGSNYTFTNDPGKYYVLIYNKGEEDVSFKYELVIYKHRVVEQYNGIISLIGSGILLISVLGVFYLKMKELSEKYPDHLKKGVIECWSEKIYRHKCQVPIFEIDTVIMEKLDNVMEKLGYKLREKLSSFVHVYEKTPPILKRFKNKPVEVIASIEEPYLTFYYNVWTIVASGSKDLSWIINEVQKIQYLLQGNKPIPDRNRENRE